MNRIEEVKKILNENDPDYVAEASGADLDDFASEICHLFPQPEEAKREFAHFVISHIWQFARGTGYPLKWEISDADFRSVLKHYGIKWGDERIGMGISHTESKGGN